MGVFAGRKDQVETGGLEPQAQELAEQIAHCLRPRLRQAGVRKFQR